MAGFHHRILKLSIYAFVIIFVSVSVSISATIDFSPLFYIRIGKHEKRVDLLGPFLSFYKTETKSGWAIRPILSYEKTVRKSSWHFIYPIFRYEKKKGERRGFLPFLVNKGEKNYTEIFPFYWGRSKNGKYFGFFPFYGKFRDRFDRDKITFFLWPLYLYSKKGDTKTYRILWPIFTYKHGGGEKAFKIFPIWGFDKKEGKYSKGYFLWPIIFYKKSDLDTAWPKSLFSIFPLYISKKSPNSRSTTILWPFFRFYKRENYRSFDAPWPIFGMSRGKDRKEFRLIPLYTYKKTKNLKSFFVLYPLYKHELDTSYGRKIVTDYFLIIDRYERRYDKNGKLISKTMKFWPFFYYSSDRIEAKSSFPSIFPIDDYGFERNYGPVFRIYLYKKSPHYKYTNILWGTYRHKVEGENESRSLSFVFSSERRKDYKKISILAGLLQYIVKRGKKSLKLLYFLTIKF